MSDASERFLDLATKPLEGNHELHFHARSEIGSKLKPGVDVELEEASMRLEKRDRAGWGAFASRWIGLAVVLTILVYLGIQVRALNESRQVLGFFINPFDHIGEWSQMNQSYLERSLGNQSSGDRLLLVADRKKAPEAARQLWDQEPTNAAFLANYAACYFRDTDQLPPDLMETAGRLDPDNGWFPALAAAASANGSVKGESVPSSGKGVHAPKVWTILDPEKLEQSISFLHQAAELQRFESYQKALGRRRRACLPPTTDVNSALMNASCCSEAEPSSFVAILGISKAIAAKAQVLAISGDKDGFRRLLADWAAISKSMIAQKESGLMDLLVQRAFISTPVRNLKAAADQLSLSDEAKQLDEVSALIELKATERRVRDLSEIDRFYENHGSVVGKPTFNMTTGVPSRPPVLNDIDLMPGRRIDHSLFSSAVAVLLASMFLVITAGTGAYRYRQGRLCRELANRLASLFTARNWCMVLTCGLILPTLYFAAIRYFTPLGRLGWSLKMPFLLIPAGQYALLFCLILATSVLILRHCFSKQAAFLDTPQPRQRLGVLLTILGFGALPLWGLAKDAAWLEPAFVAGATGLGLLVLWLLGLVIRALFGSADQALGRQVIGRLLVPIQIGGAVLFSAFVPLHHAEERYWMRQDRMLGLNPENPDTSDYETVIKDLTRDELLKTLAPLESISP